MIKVCKCLVKTKKRPFRVPVGSIADPGLFIPDPIFYIPDPGLTKIPDPDPHQRISVFESFNPKKLKISSQK
jgi:hypothetical protein